MAGSGSAADVDDEDRDEAAAVDEALCPATAGDRSSSSGEYRHVAFADANRVVREGRAEEWQVRPSVKYRWRLPAGGAEGECGVAWRDVNCAAAGSGADQGRGKILLAGDSLSSLTYLSFRNHMRMCSEAGAAGGWATHAGHTGSASVTSSRSRASGDSGEGAGDDSFARGSNGESDNGKIARGNGAMVSDDMNGPPLPSEMEESKLAVCTAEVEQSVMRNMHNHVLCDSVTYGNTTVTIVRNERAPHQARAPAQIP
ncbi:hypothetical protein CLOP_g5902 [Closterium sp. NIES-67]|nr:hypothetical protein CLOP_g5902 [Closterium sp. NIES-67]